MSASGKCIKSFYYNLEFSCHIWNWFFNDNFYYPMRINLKILSQTSLWRGFKSSSRVGLEYLTFSLLPYCAIFGFILYHFVFWKGSWFMHHFLFFSLIQLVRYLHCFFGYKGKRKKELRSHKSSTINISG